MLYDKYLFLDNLELPSEPEILREVQCLKKVILVQVQI